MLILQGLRYGGSMKIYDYFLLSYLYLKMRLHSFIESSYSRNFSAALSLAAFFVLFISFQNCGKNLTACTTTGTTKSSSNSTASSSSNSGKNSSSSTNCPAVISSQQSSTQPTSNANSGSHLSSSGSSSGFTLGASSTSSGNGFSSSSGGTYTSSGGYSSSGSYGTSSSSGVVTSTSSGGGGGYASEPLAVSMNSSIEYEGQIVALNLRVSGGTPPVTFQWFKGATALMPAPSSIPMFNTGSTTDPFSFEDIYKVIITDGTGAQYPYTFDTRSGCEAGTYYSAAVLMNNVQGLFNPFNNPSGKFLMRANNPSMYNITPPGAVSNAETNLTQPLPLGAIKTISCKNLLPGIHAPDVRPDAGCGGWENPCTDPANFENNHYYTYQGDIRFTCRNNKFHFESKQCTWVSTGNVPPNN